MENGKKIAEARGLYDPLRLSISQKTYQSSGEIGDRKYDTMKPEKKQTGGNYIGWEDVESKEITELEILKNDEGHADVWEHTFEAKDGKPQSTKYQAHVTYDGYKNSDKLIWTLSGKNSNIIMEIVDAENTDNWHGKYPIMISGEGKFKHIAIDVVRLKKERNK